MNFWPSLDNVENVINPLADTSGVILAIHEPMSFDLTEHNNNYGIKEETELLKKFLEPYPTNGYMLYTVTGQSGVGKSHAIKWMEAQLIKTYGENNPQKIIIRVKKEDGLRNILVGLLKKLNLYDEFEEKLNNAGNNLTLSDSKEYFRANLLIIIREKKTLLENGNAFELDSDKQRLLKFLKEENLPAFIQDPITSGWFLDKVADEILSLQLDGNINNIPIQFDGTFLNPPNEVFMGAAKNTKEFLQNINNKVNQERSYRVLLKFLNDELMNTLRRTLYKRYEMSLPEIFVDIRRKLFELHGADVEIFLLLEDFANLATLQKDFLEVIIQPGFDDDKQYLCTIKSLLAVTEGYFAFDTVVTRTNSVWKIIDEYGQADNEQISKRIINYIGKYLNVARWGHDYAIKYGDALDNFANKDNIYNTESIKKLDAFGKSHDGDGYHLFPFNKTCINQLIEEKFRTSNGAIIFNPRKIINELLLPILKKRQNFEYGDFPTKDEFKNVEVKPPVATELKNLNIDINERYSRFFYYWCGNPETLKELPKNSFDMMDLFKINLKDKNLNEIEQQPKEISFIANQDQVALPHPIQPPSLLSTIETWDPEKILTQQNTQDLRTKLFTAINNYQISNSRNKDRWKGEDLFLPAAHNKPTKPVCEVINSEDFLDNIKRRDAKHRIVSLIKFEHFQTWSFERSDDDIHRYIGLMQELSDKVISKLNEDYGEISSDPLRLLVQNLYLGSYVLNMTPPDNLSSNAKQLWRVFSKTPDNNDNINRFPQDWKDLYQSCQDARCETINELLKRVGIFKGDGTQPHGIKMITEILNFCNDGFIEIRGINDKCPIKIKTNYNKLRQINVAIVQINDDLNRFINLYEKEIGVDNPIEIYEQLSNVFNQLPKVNLGGDVNLNQQIVKLRDYNPIEIIEYIRKLNNIKDIIEFMKGLDPDVYSRMKSLSDLINEIRNFIKSRNISLEKNVSLGENEVQISKNKFVETFDKIKSSINCLLNEDTL